MKVMARLVLIGWFFLILPPSGGYQVIGPYNSQRGCRDWLGSCLYHHPPACHNNPTPANCTPDGPGFGGGWCSSDCSFIGHQGWYYLGADTKLHGPYAPRRCSRFSMECFFVGNTGE